MNQKQDKYMIWGNLNLDYKDWRDDLEYQYPDLSENERFELMHEMNAECLSDVRERLDI